MFDQEKVFVVFTVSDTLKLPLWSGGTEGGNLFIYLFFLLALSEDNCSPSLPSEAVIWIYFFLFGQSTQLACAGLGGEDNLCLIPTQFYFVLGAKYAFLPLAHLQRLDVF